MSKYHATATTVDGIRFHSKREAARYQELCLRVLAGEIYGLELQPRFALQSPVRGHSGPWDRVHLGDYVADFRYREGPRGILVVEDVKGCKTALYRWKKKHVEAQYGITILET